MAGPSDAELIASSLDDPAAFEVIFDRHFETVRRYLGRRVGSDAGDELAAQTFELAFARRRSFDASFSSAAPWLFGIAGNLLRRHHRTERIHRSALERLERPSGPDDVMDAEAVDALRSMRIVREVLAGVPTTDREAFLLVVLADRSYSEAAEILRIPAGTVRSKIHRVRALLRERLMLEVATTDRDRDG